MASLIRTLTSFFKRSATTYPAPLGRRAVRSAVSESLARRGPSMQSARWHAGNNPLAAKATNTLAAALTGTGIKPQSQHPDQTTRRDLNSRFETWTDGAAPDGRSDFYALQAEAARALVRDGEAFFLLQTLETPSGPALTLRLLSPDQIDPALHRELGDGRRIVAGVEFDANGQRVAYHILPDQPDLPFAHFSTPIRVSADDVLHIFEPQFPGQVRGVSWFAPALGTMHELASAEQAQLVRQKVGALLAGFIYDQEGSAAGFSGTQTGSIMETGLEPGTLKVLPPGTDIKFSDPPNIGADAIDFMKLQQREIAAALGLTYEQLTGDLSGVNYSSIRAGLNEFRRRVETVQHHILIPQLCRPVWRRWIALEALAGRIPFDAFMRDPSPWQSVQWIPPGWLWVDAEREIKADALAVQSGFKSRREVVASRGLDIEALDEEAAADAARAQALGLNLNPQQGGNP